jgi:hypothetical protein
MIEQWFLDLDGTRSGPYQTPEVMSLIAEGEVLPHHRIATSLRTQSWQTILDWRLEQAKLTQNFPNYQFSSSRSEVGAIDVVEEPAAQESINREVFFSAPPSVENSAPVFIQPVAADTSPAEPDPFLNVPEETPVSLPETSLKQSSHEPPKRLHTNETLPPLVSSTETPPSDPSKPKRDPMAEMFDLLQNTKHKREAKQTKAAISKSAAETQEAPRKSSGGLTKTLMIGAGITLIGFALGQVFQQEAAPTHDTATKSTPSFTPIPSLPTTTTGSTATTHTEVIDRSNDKLTIREVVERKVEASPTPSPHSLSRTGRSIGPNGSAENPQTEKELEELRNLKKELQELKNLKNTAVDEEQPPNQDADGYDANDPNNPNNTNQPPANDPDQNQPNR